MIDGQIKIGIDHLKKKVFIAVSKGTLNLTTDMDYTSAFQLAAQMKASATVLRNFNEEKESK